MKTFCQKCGNELVSGASICAKCGFENLVKENRRDRMILVMALLCVLIVAGAGFFFRGKIASLYERVRSGHGIASITDADFGKKELFRGAYEKYLLDRSYFLNAQGIVGIESAGADELYKQRESLLAEIESKGCYSENFDRCSDLKSKILNIDSTLERMTEERRGNQMRLNDTCERCDTDIQKLFEAGSSLSNMNNASALVEFSSTLRKHQAGYSKVMQKKNYLSADERVSQVSIRGDGSFSDRLIQDRINAIPGLSDEISKEAGILNDEITSINDYIGVLNGNLKLNLPLIEKVR